jgi:hypothetical protein
MFPKLKKMFDPPPGRHLAEAEKKGKAAAKKRGEEDKDYLHNLKKKYIKDPKSLSDKELKLLNV